MQKHGPRLSKLFSGQPNTKIAIDNPVETDEQGNYLINVGYLRVSTDKQVEKYGLGIQEDSILQYAKGRFSSLILFIDDGYTGTNMERPALQAIIRYMDAYNAGRSKIKINTFIVARIDRLGRSLLGTLQFIQDYIVSQRDSKNSSKNHNREDINFVSVAENYCRIDKTNPQSKFLLMLFATLAEFDRDQIVEKLKNGRTARVASGKWVGGGNVPFGYRYDRTTGTLRIQPDEAAIVQEIYRLYTEEHLSPARIAQRFGFSTDVRVAQILKNKTLTGVLLWQGQEYPGRHEAIIPPETWEHAQAELHRRSVHRSDSHYLLTSLLYCGVCGSRMRYQKWGKSGVKIYCCNIQTGNTLNETACRTPRYWKEDIEDAVVTELFRLSYLGNVHHTKSIPALPDPASVLADELSKAKRQLGRLYDLAADGVEDDVLMDKIAVCRRKIAGLQAQIEEERTKATTSRKTERAKSLLRNLKSTWPMMTDAERQRICQELIDRVVVYPGGQIDVHLKLKSYLAMQEKD